MGWLFYTDPSRVRRYAGEKAEITRLTSHETEQASYTPLQLSKVGSTWYAAIHCAPNPGNVLGADTYVTDPDGSFTFAAIFHIRYDRGCFGYKDMDETAGPNEARAPITLLDRLSPLVDPSGYAADWRQRCRDWAEIPRYHDGDVIALGRPIPLTDGTVIQAVRKESYRHRGKTHAVYVDVETGAHWRLKRAHFAGSRLKTSALSAGTGILAEFAARQARRS